MTDREIDLLVIKTINEILKHVSFDNEHGICVSGLGINALRDAFKHVAAQIGEKRGGP